MVWKKKKKKKKLQHFLYSINKKKNVIYFMYVKVLNTWEISNSIKLVILYVIMKTIKEIFD
jgi:hypothetical protein